MVGNEYSLLEQRGHAQPRGKVYMYVVMEVTEYHKAQRRGNIAAEWEAVRNKGVVIRGCVHLLAPPVGSPRQTQTNSDRFGFKPQVIITIESSLGWLDENTVRLRRGSGGAALFRYSGEGGF